MSAQAHIDYDIAIEEAQDRLTAAQQTADEELESAKAQVVELADEIAGEYDEAIATYNIKMAAARETEGLVRDRFKTDYNKARDIYWEEIAAARATFRSALQQEVH